MNSPTPPGWPAGVRPPQAAGWERGAVAWLLDLCPADYRGYAVLTRHPLALAHLAQNHVDADLAAVRLARAQARTALSQDLLPPVITQVLSVLDTEEARLLAARRGVGLIEGGLRGDRYLPRL